MDTNRRVLERIKQTGDIFWAISDRNWILDGANVHVSMVGFDNGDQIERILDEGNVTTINSDLTSASNLTQAKCLPENLNLSFIGTQKGGQFDIPVEQAQSMLALTGNPNHRFNSEVIKPWINGIDITQRSSKDVDHRFRR